MAVSRRSVRPRFTLLLLLLTAATFIVLNGRSDANGVIGKVKSFSRDAFAPLQSAGEAVFRPIDNVFGGIIHYGELKDENARLRDQLQELQSERQKAADADRERKALLDLQNLQFTGDIPTAPARVISASASNFELTLQIDKGTDAGVLKEMPVVSGGGLVGRVIEVSETRSTVLLITAPNSSVGVRLTGSGDVGVATGEGRDEDLTVDLVENSTLLAKNEPVVTSGLQRSTFPPGIPVGTISNSPVQRNGSLQRTVRISPSVDLSRLTFVSVLLWSPDS